MPDDPQLDRLKLPPHSLEAEQSVLGGLLLDNDAADQVGDVISDADFYSEAHRLVYAHIVRLVGDTKPADVVTVSESLASAQKLDYVGGLAYLGALVENVPTAANIRHYAQIVRDRSILRQLAGTAGDIADSAYHPQGTQREGGARPGRSEDPAHRRARRARHPDVCGDRHAAGRSGRADRDAVQPRRSVGSHRRADRDSRTWTRRRPDCSPATS
jgi:hypothetical protein